jgi:hypothetical protein
MTTSEQQIEALNRVNLTDSEFALLLELSEKTIAAEAA